MNADINERMAQRLQQFRQIWTSRRSILGQQLAQSFEELTPTLIELNHINLMESLLLLDQVQYYDGRFMKEWAKTSAPRIAEFSSKELSNIMRIFAKVSQIDLPFFSVILNKSISIIDHFSCRDLAYIGAAFTKLRLNDENFTRVWTIRTTDRLHDADSSDLAKIINTLAKSHDCYNHNIMSDWLRLMQRQKVKSSASNIHNAFFLTMILATRFPDGEAIALKEEIKNFTFSLINNIVYSTIIPFPTTKYTINNCQLT